MGSQKLLAVIGLAVALIVVVAGSARGAAMTKSVLVQSEGNIAFSLGGSLVAVNPGRPGVLRTVTSCPGTGCTIADPAWSPNGRSIAYVQGAFAVNSPSHMALYVTTGSGAPRRLAGCGSCGWGERVGWSPNGKWIAFDRDGFHSGRETLWIVAAAGGKPRQLTHCRRRCADVNPDWSPNGRLILYAHSVGGSTTLYTVRPNGTDQTKIASGEDPQWSPDGHRIVFEDANGIEVANADGSDVHLLFAQTGGAGPGVPSWSPDGKKLVFFNTPGGPSNYTAEVWTMNADGSGQSRLYQSGCCVGDWAAPIWSPNGTMIAFSADSAHGTYVINANGSGLKQLTSNDAFATMSWQKLGKQRTILVTPREPKPGPVFRNDD